MYVILEFYLSLKFNTLFGFFLAIKVDTVETPGYFIGKPKDGSSIWLIRISNCNSYFDKISIFKNKL